MAAASKMKGLPSVFFDPGMDEALRQAAFRRKVSKGELMRTYMERGLASELPGKSASAASRSQARTVIARAVEPRPARAAAERAPQARAASRKAAAAV